MVVGKLDGFTFKLHKNTFQEFQHAINASFAQFHPIKGQKSLGNSGGYEEPIQLNGVVVQLPINHLDYFKNKTKEREPVRLTTKWFDEHVVILNLSLQNSVFDAVGKFRVATFDLSLEVLYGEIL